LAKAEPLCSFSPSFKSKCRLGGGPGHDGHPATLRVGAAEPACNSGRSAVAVAGLVEGEHHTAMAGAFGGNAARVSELMPPWTARFPEGGILGVAFAGCGSAVEPALSWFAASL